MNTLKQSGAMGVINRGFTTITDEPRIQLIIIGFMFGAFIEGAAGYGTPGCSGSPLADQFGFLRYVRNGGVGVKQCAG